MRAAPGGFFFFGRLAPHAAESLVTFCFYAGRRGQFISKIDFRPANF